MSPPVLLFFGAGLNVGIAVMKRFRADGYKIAAVARSEKPEITAVSDLFIPADLAADPAQIAGIFEKVGREFGRPGVVVYNAYSSSFAPDGSHPFSIPPASLAKDLAVNSISSYACAFAFAALPPPTSGPNVFIFTGNMTSALLVPEVMTLGIGKNATNYFIEMAANVYGKAGKGFWYTADERTETGGSTMSQIDGEAHAEFYAELVGRKEQGNWNQTFVKGKGYVDFESQRERPLKGAGELMTDLGLEWPPKQ